MRGSDPKLPEVVCLMPNAEGVENPGLVLTTNSGAIVAYRWRKSEVTRGVRDPIAMVRLRRRLWRLGEAATPAALGQTGEKASQFFFRSASGDFLLVDLPIRLHQLKNLNAGRTAENFHGILRSLSRVLHPSDRVIHHVDVLKLHPIIRVISCRSQIL